MIFLGCCETKMSEGARLRSSKELWSWNQLAPCPRVWNRIDWQVSDTLVSKWNVESNQGRKYFLHPDSEVHECLRLIILTTSQLHKTFLYLQISSACSIPFQICQRSVMNPGLYRLLPGKWNVSHWHPWSLCIGGWRRSHWITKKASTAIIAAE